ncbi:MAG: rRNA maturation RNase YbeY [Sphaerochaetaceae bacterium]|jgi:probable rRNA maturation factor|nr:rRNA maturation RNase YbeY [Sphaerochaetaceae bacterium]MDD3162456.1 rRNA maturation RNase YbeY [Sphaerochaetaceae bacterium]MDD4006792.1 rRNA maturation RNase YbeY [Sphaerochaetaceae bacterium]MDD4396847.1 rRNA maturation RNase YbeY [Sphaerochaetaceae bacterium]
MNRFMISYEEPAMKQEAPAALVRKVLGFTCRELALHDVEISCSFVSDKTIHELNLKYRNIDESTDVLSFVQHDADSEVTFPGCSGEPNELGDLVISLDTLKNNAEYFSIPFSEELCRVLIHGCLHLNGEDHKSNSPEEAMLKKQEALLNKLKGGLI